MKPVFELDFDEISMLIDAMKHKHGTSAGTSEGRLQAKLFTLLLVASKPKSSPDAMTKERATT